MKYIIASDIHGSSFYCEKLVEAFKKEKGDKLVLLGDILYHGPRNDLPDKYHPKSVIQMLNEIKDKILCVRGNCDTEVDQMVLEFPILADYAILENAGRLIYLTHGHIYNGDRLPPIKDGDIILHGHTHVPLCDVNSKRICLNPGSTSIPKSNSYNGYMTLEDGLFEWKDLDGNLKNTLCIKEC